MTDDVSPVPTPRFNQIVHSAAEIARSMHHSYIGVEHLFIAIIRDPHAIPTQALAGSISVEEVETRLLGIMNSTSYRTPGPPPPGARDIDGDK